jgi:adenylate cyclase
VHWIDPESDALLSQLVEAMGWTRTLLLVNYRPEYRAAWMEGSYCQSLALAPLERAAIQSLLQELLGDDPSLAPLVEQVSERTRGNPFFVEEVVQSLSASGHLAGEPGRYRLVRPGESVPIPATVQAVIGARMDRLPERERQVLRLCELEFVHEQDGPGGREYVFKHPLTQEVAYRGQLGEPRAALHATVARSLETLFSSRLGEQAGLIAHHWESAGNRHEARRWRQRAALRVSNIQIRGRRAEC